MSDADLQSHVLAGYANWKVKRGPVRWLWVSPHLFHGGPTHGRFFSLQLSA
jgi:hypothetical protein